MTMTCPGCGHAHAEPHAETKLGDLPNLGAVSADWLHQAGLDTVAELAAIGPVAAYLRVERLGFKPSLNLLYALQGAVSGEHWLEVKLHRKADMLAALAAARESAPS